MSPMKPGSGNLDFGQSDSDTEESKDENNDSAKESKSTPEFVPKPDSEARSNRTQSDRDTEPRESDPASETSVNKSDSEVEIGQYPYFIRRRNVMDERNQRIELHLRKTVSNEEAAFRSALADELDAGEVSKTDAREFALKFAFQNPAAVAELMREEGYRAGD